MPRPTNVLMLLVGWIAYWGAYVTVQFLARIYWRGDIRGMENVPASGPFVIAPVHRSNVDGPLVVILTRRRIRYMSKSGMFKMKWLGEIYRAMGAFPVNRDIADRVALKRASEVLDNGEPLVLFPEGTRKSGPTIEDLHEGAVYLAMKAGAPIVPVGIGNSEKASPKGKFFLRPIKVRMIIGEPIVYEKADGRIPRSAITETTEQLRERLQGLYDEARNPVRNR